MNSKLIYAEDIATTAHAIMSELGETDQKVRHEQYNSFVVRLNKEAMDGYDAYFGIVKSVKYNDKTDKYVIEHQHGTAKCTDDVANFLLSNAFQRSMRPTVNAQIVKGTVIAVALRFLSEKD